MNDEERQKKIEAGKKLSISLRKNKLKNAKSKNIDFCASKAATSHQLCEGGSVKIVNSRVSDRQNIFAEMMSSDAHTEGSLNQSEGSDDASHLVKADSELIFLYEKKMKEFKVENEKKDNLIQGLVKSLEETMKRCQDNENYHQEIATLQQQSKELSETIEKQKTKPESSELIQFEDSNTQTEARLLHDTGVQFESLNPDSSVVDTLATCSKMPNFYEEMIQFLMNQSSKPEVLNLVKQLQSRIGDEEDISSANLQSTFAKKLEALNAVAKLIESLVSAATNRFNTHDVTNEFSCSKFQDFFIKRMNSDEQEVEVSESETSDINYAESAQCNKSSSRGSDHSSIERLRNRVNASDFTMVTGFLEDEMHRLTQCMPTGDDQPSLETDKAGLLRRLDIQRMSLDARVKNLKRLDKDLQDAERVLKHRSVDSDTSTNFDILEELPLSRISLLSLTDSTADYVTDSESNNLSRKVSLDSNWRPAQDMVCAKCDRCLEMMRDRCDDHLCIFKDVLEKDLEQLKLDHEQLKQQVRLFQNQCEQLKQKDAELGAQNEQLTQHRELIKEQNEQLLSDHNQLYKSHEQLKREFEHTREQMRKEQEQLNQEIKQLKTEKDRLELLNQENEQLKRGISDQVREKTDQKRVQIEQLNQEIKQLKLKKERLEQLNLEYERLKQDNEQTKQLETELLGRVGDLETEQKLSLQKIHDILAEKAEIADLVQEMHQDALETAEIHQRKLKNLESEHTSMVETMTKKHIEELEGIKVLHASQMIIDHEQVLESQSQKFENLIQTLRTEHETRLQEMEIEHEKRLQDSEAEHEKRLQETRTEHEKRLQEVKTRTLAECTALTDQHSGVLSSVEMSHAGECAILRNKIDQLQEEKCRIVADTTEKYKALLSKNHKVLLNLCNHLCSKMTNQKKRLLSDSRTEQSVLETSYCDALNELNRSVEDGIIKFLNQKYFANEELLLDETEYFEIGDRVQEREYLSDQASERGQKSVESVCTQDPATASLGQLSDLARSESSLEPEDRVLLCAKISELQEQFQTDVLMYENINDNLHRECQDKQRQIRELEDLIQNMTKQLTEKENELSSKESQLASIDSDSAKPRASHIRLSSPDIKNWQDAAQTTSQLLRVLSDLVKSNMDIEKDINSYLLRHGLEPLQSDMTQHDDETGPGVCSKDDFASLGECCPNLELTEDGPDLTPRAWDMFGGGDNEMEGEDVVLGPSRRLKLAVDHLLHLLSLSFESHQQHQEHKLLMRRCEELTAELHEECTARDALHMELVTAKSELPSLLMNNHSLEKSNSIIRKIGNI